MTEHIALPIEALSQHVAVLGKTGSGKTSTAKLAIEQVVAQGARVCVLDSVKSDWWGITSSADGEKPGLPFTILGGPRGHVPLHSSAGQVIGQLVGSGKLPLSIIDMADFEAGGLQKFFIDFAPALMRHARGVVYLVIEEAHEFAPKERSGIGAESMAIHWAKKLATAGRSKGIRLIVATQRIQALHNAVLGSCDTLIAHRLTAPADQEPVVKWLKANVEKSVATAIATSLSSLRTGTGWICSGEAKIFRQCDFPRITTYDNTATPTDDDHRHEVKTAPVDQEKLRAVIGTAVEEAKANDPDELRKKIAELQREVTRARASAPSPSQGEGKAVIDMAAIDRARNEGYQDGDADGYKRGKLEAADDLRRQRAAINAAMGYLAPFIEAEDGGVPIIDVRRVPDPPIIDQTPPPSSIAAPPPRQPRTPRPADGSLHAAARAMLTALAQNSPARFTWQQTATLAGLKARGGHYNAGKKDLIDRGLVTIDGDLIGADKMGLKLIGTVPPKPSTPREIVDMWCARLPAPAPEMLRYIVLAGGRAVPRDELATALQKQPHGGHWNGGIANLRNNGLVETVGNALKPAALLLEARR